MLMNNAKLLLGGSELPINYMPMTSGGDYSRLPARLAESGHQITYRLCVDISFSQPCMLRTAEHPDERLLRTSISSGILNSNRDLESHQHQ